MYRHLGILQSGSLLPVVDGEGGLRISSAGLVLDPGPRGTRSASNNRTGEVDVGNLIAPSAIYASLCNCIETDQFGNCETGQALCLSSST